MEVLKGLIKSLALIEKSEIEALRSFSKRTASFTVFFREKPELEPGEQVALMVVSAKVGMVEGFAQMTALREAPLGGIMPAEWASHLGLRDKPLFARYMTQAGGSKIDDHSMFYVATFKVIGLFS